MTSAELILLWAERDRRYRMPHGTPIDEELEKGILANRGWEVGHLVGQRERGKAFAELRQWVPPRRWSE